MAEIINLRRAKSVVENFFKDWDINIEYELDNRRLRCKSNISARPYDDDIFFSIWVYPSGHVSCNFYFDYLRVNEHTLSLVNDFNQHVVGLKASIDPEDGGVLVTHEANVLTEDILDICIGAVMSNLVDEDTVKYMRPITELTTGK